MSKGQMLRALVTRRLSAAAEEIFALFERTILEYEEELCRSVEENQRKQRLLDTFLSPAALPHRGATSPPGPGLNQETRTETAQVKEETEEHGVKQEEEQLQVPFSEFSAVCVKTEESSLLQERQTEHQEETQGEDISSEPHFYSEGHTERSSDADNGDDWAAPFRWSAAHMDTEADGDHYSQVQIRDRSAAAQLSGLSPDHTSAPETSATVDNGHVSETGHRAERKKYQCFICPKRFESNILLQIHIRVHTGEKPYSCPICKKAFAQKNNLNAHRRIHTGEKPYSCSLCKKTFGRRCTLKRHMKIHTAAKPSLCNNTFTASCVVSDENSHILSHMK